MDHISSFITADTLSKADLTANAVNIAENYYIHVKQTAKAIEHHKDSIDKASISHEENLRITIQAHLIDTFTSLEQHFQQLNADLALNWKESERDMFDQRNQQYQTIILSSSVMFAALSTVIIQGILPSGSSPAICIAYAVTTSLSFAFLFICIVLCIEIISKASHFMYGKSKDHTDNLSEAIENTKAEMEKIMKNEASSSNSDEKERWKTHGELIRDMLDKREEINRKVAYQKEAKEGQKPFEPFEDFWNKSCKIWGRIAILFFYVGTYNLLLAIGLFMGTYFFYKYDSFAGAIIASSFIGSSLFLGFIILCFVNNNDDDNNRCKHRFFPLWPTNIRNINNNENA